MRQRRIVTTTDQNALLPLLELGVRPVASAGSLEEDGTETFRRVEDFDTSGIEFVGSYGQPNAEAVANQRPDLISGYEFDEDYYDTLSQVAPTVLVRIFDRDLDEALLDFADLVGRRDRARQLQADYARRTDSLLEKLGDRREDLNVSVISSGDSAGRFYRAEVGQALGTVMGDLNLPLPAPQRGAGDFDPFSLETISEHGADVVLVVSYSEEGQDPSFRAARRVPAVQVPGGVRGGPGVRHRRHRDRGRRGGPDGGLSRRPRAHPARPRPRRGRGPGVTPAPGSASCGLPEHPEGDA